jgi:hypothetical protein
MRRADIAAVLAALASFVCSQAANAQLVGIKIAQPSAATDSEPFVPMEEAEELAETIRQAFAAHDSQLIFEAAKWDGVSEEHAAIFRGFVTRLVEVDIKGVALQPLGDTFAPFEYQGETFAKNGEIVGQVAVSFLVEPPAVYSSLIWPYTIEDGKAVILLDAPVADR